MFATAEALDERVRALVEAESRPRAVILDFAGVDFIDSQGSEKLGDIRQFADASDVTLRLARLKPSIRATITTDGVLDQIGEAYLHGNVDEAVEAPAQPAPSRCDVTRPSTVPTRAPTTMSPG